MKIQLWFRVTSLLVFLQIALGGLLTFSFIIALPHIITGFIVLAFAIVALVMAQRLKPPFRPLQGLSVGLVLLIVVQIVLGFTTLSTGNQVIAWVHLLVAMAIYGMVIAGTLMSMRLDYRSKEQSVATVGPHPLNLSVTYPHCPTHLPFRAGVLNRNRSHLSLDLTFDPVEDLHYPLCNGYGDKPHPRLLFDPF